LLRRQVVGGPSLYAHEDERDNVPLVKGMQRSDGLALEVKGPGRGRGGGGAPAGGPHSGPMAAAAAALRRLCCCGGDAAGDDL
jgi:hypothetical protein